MLVTQTFDKEKFEAATRNHLRTSAFRDWQHRLNRGDKLPRGKFFKGKQAGKPFMMMDEAHFLNESYAVINSEVRRAGFRIDMNQMQATVENNV